MIQRCNLPLQSSYDSVSSYDSYNNRLGPNAHDDLKCGTSNGTGVSPRNHDPYRFTRSTAQPIGNKNEKPNKPPDYNKYRYANMFIIQLINLVGIWFIFNFCSDLSVS
jgi:tight junction protein 1